MTERLDRGLDIFSNDDYRDDQFVGSITSVDNCVCDDYNLNEPLPGVWCKDLMYYAWKNCYNQGRGGTVTAGCLKYSLRTYH